MRAVLLDLDDTLIDTRSCAAAAFAAASERARERFPAIGHDELRQSYQKVVHEVDRLMERGDLRYPTTRELHRDRWRRILADCSIEDGDAAGLGECYSRTRAQNHRLYPDSLPTLALLRARYALALVTNGPADFQREKIRAAGLDSWFGEILISGELGLWKPDAGIFQEALDRLACDAGEAVMVGDSLRHDIGGAAAIGIATVWINRHAAPEPAAPRPRAIVRELGDLTAVLSGWE